MVAASGTRHGRSFWEEEKANKGLKMMERMGWKQGTGLGSKGHGAVTHIRVRQKKDNAGIGATAATADDAWRATQDVFNSILTRLNDGTAEEEDEDAARAPAPTVQQAMVRHSLYRKFRAAKRATGYSSTDMAMIMGRREEETPVAHRPSAQAGPEPALASEEVQTTTASVTIREYFAARMQSCRLAGGRSPAAAAGDGVGAGGAVGFTEETQIALAAQVAAGAEAHAGRRGLGYASERTAAAAMEGGRVERAPRVVTPDPAMPAPSEPVAKRAGPSWKRALRLAMQGCPADGGLPRKAVKRAVLAHFGGTLKRRTVEARLDRKLARVGYLLEDGMVRAPGNRQRATRKGSKANGR